MGKDRIFVSIAAYRDPELARTVRDLFAHAARPEKLTVAIFDQAEKPAALPDRPRGARLIYERRDPAESQGACWARTQLQQRMNGEGFYLQLDSHHLFKRGWDKLALAELAACPSPRAVLTSYLPPYELRRGKPRRNAAAATPMHFSHFDDDGVIIYRSYSYEKEVRGGPVPARFFSGHFTFARREFVERVPYDPELYFYGEESSMAARAFTHGFDLFHPGQTIAWHHYGRQGRPRHWDDHPEDGGTGRSWFELQRRGLFKYRRIFCLLPHVSPTDGLGLHRSLAQYEAWTGVDHYWQLTHPATVALQSPPTAAELDWTVSEGLLTQAEVQVDLPRLASIDTRPCTQVHVAILDATPRDGAAIRCSPAEYAALQKTGWKVLVRYRTGPLRLVVWPLLGTEWGNRFEAHLELPDLVNARPFRPARPKKPSPPRPARRSRLPRKRPA